MGRWSWSDLGARPLVFPTVFLGLGCALGPVVPSPPLLSLAVGALLAGLALLRRGSSGAHLLLLAAAAMLGLGLAAADARTTGPALPSDRPVRLEGELLSVDRAASGTRALLAVARADDSAGLRARVQLWAPPGGVAIHSGQRVLLTATLHPLEGPGTWGEWDWTAPARRRAVTHAGRFDPFSVLPATPATAVAPWLEARRLALARLARAEAPSADAAALYAALAAGLRAELDPRWENLFARSGLAHVLSVSGLHVAALAVGVLVALRWLLVRLLPGLARRWEARRAAALLALPALWAYVAFTGFQGPAVRSALMASAAFLGLLLGRGPDALNALALAAWVVCVRDPASVADLSLQLSFLAVLALVLLAPALRAALPIPRPDVAQPSRKRLRLERVREAVMGTFCASAAVTLATAPLVAGAFHRVSLAGLVSNVVCLPLCGVLTALGAAGAALSCVLPSVAGPVVWIGTRAAAVLLAAVDLFAALPGSSVGAPGFELLAGVAWGAGLLAFALGRRRLRALALLVPATAAWVFLGPVLQPGPPLRVTFLAVGQGDAAVVSSAGVHLLVDGGGTPGGADPGTRTVLPYLREAGITRLAAVVLSHPHPDHALGLVSVLREVPTERLWLPPGPLGPLEQALVHAAPGARVERVARGHTLTLGKATVEVLSPPEDAPGLLTVNDRSLVLRISLGATSVLFPGDVEATAEEGLHPGAVSVVKAPHHGSRTSSTPRLVEETHPAVVVFSVGRHNRFGFPDPSVIARWQAVGSEALRTDRDGAVRVTSDGRGLVWETFRGARGSR